MPVTFVDTPVIETMAQTLAIGHNVRGRLENGLLETALHYQYPSAFSTFQRRARLGKIKVGEVFLWAETKPHLLFMAVRESNVGITRLRYVQQVALVISRDFWLYGLTSLAIAPTGNAYERSEINAIWTQWFSRCPLDITVHSC
jgi:hypothetical protein